MTGADGKEKYVMLSTVDDKIYELAEVNTVESESLTVSTLNKNLKTSNTNVINFIGDSGATEHIVKDASCLTNVVKVNGVIKSANKNELANL